MEDDKRGKKNCCQHRATHFEIQLQDDAWLSFCSIEISFLPRLHTFYDIFTSIHLKIIVFFFFLSELLVELASHQSNCAECEEKKRKIKTFAKTVFFLEVFLLPYTCFT